MRRQRPPKDYDQLGMLLVVIVVASIVLGYLVNLAGEIPQIP